MNAAAERHGVRRTAKKPVFSCFTLEGSGGLDRLATLARRVKRLGLLRAVGVVQHRGVGFARGRGLEQRRADVLPVRATGASRRAWLFPSSSLFPVLVTTRRFCGSSAESPSRERFVRCWAPSTNRLTSVCSRRPARIIVYLDRGGAPSAAETQGVSRTRKRRRDQKTNEE